MRSADRLRVAYVLKMYPRLAETFILNEIMAHEAAGLDLEIFSLRAPVDGRFHRNLSLVQTPVTYVPGQSVKAEDFWSTIRRARAEYGADDILDFADGESAADLNQAIILADEIRKRGVTHLHAHFATIATTVARLASRLTGVPYSFTAHAKDIYHESVVHDDLRRKLRDAAACVTVSNYNAAHLRAEFGTDADVVKRVYNGLDLSEFPYSEPSERPPLIVGVGRLVEKKGFADLIDACALLIERGRTFRCEILGGGVLEDRLREQVEQRGVGSHVTMHGACSREEVVARVREAAVLAAPCVISPNGNRDGLPTVLLEAMALGTPCVSTDVTGIPELVRDGDTGLLATQRKPKSLADKLEKLLDDSALGVRLATNARRAIEADFDIKRNLPQLRDIFNAGQGARTPLEVA